MNANDENLSEEDRELIRHYEEATTLGRLDYFDVDEMEIIIEHYLFDGDPRDAEKALEYGFRLHPDDRYLQCQKAAILLQRGKLREALRLLELYSDADDPVHSFNRAEILYKLGRKHDALAIFRDLVDNNDEDGDTPGLCSDIIRLTNGQQDYKASLYFFDKGLAANPNDLDLLEGKGLTLESMGETAEAAALYNKVLDADPYRVSAWHLLGALHFDHDKFRDALTAYDYALAIEPTDTVALAQKAFCQFNLGDTQGAAASCAKYLKTTPNDDEMLSLLGECYESLDMPSEAQRLYQKAIAANPKNNVAWFGAAIAALNLGETDKAKQNIRQAISLKPDMAEYFMTLADILHEEKNTDGAIDALLHIVRDLDGDMPYAWQKLGDAYMEADAFEKAAEAYERAIALCDAQRVRIDGLPLLAAIARYGNADYRQAQNHYDQAKRLDTNAKSTLLRVFPDAAKHLTL